jgi:short-subunit dehydrogenase
MMLHPESVARDIVNSIHKHRHVRIIDTRYRVLTFFWRMVPNFIWRRLKL